MGLINDGAAVPGWAAVSTDRALARLIAPGAVLRRLATGAIWSEGPVWLPEDGSVLWSDIPGNRVLRWSPPGGVTVFLEGSEFENGHALDLDGSVIACSHGERRVERLGRDGTRTAIVDRYRGARLNSPNDVVVKSDGTIWFSDPQYGIVLPQEGHLGVSEIGANLVFRFDPVTGELDAVTDSIEEPNGLAFSPDETILYVSDTSASLRTDGSGNHHIIAFDVVDGRRLANGRPFYVCEPGLPDGFRVDRDGNVWTSALDGIHVVAPDGRARGRIPVPEKTSNCVFGGAEGNLLFITASSSLYVIQTATVGATAWAAR